MNIEDLSFNSAGLIPVITQDAITGEVLMQAYMNKEALEVTLACGYMCYYSRKRKALWKKGETSGNFQEVVEARADCDLDSLLFLVLQKGFACHTGHHSCFFNKIIDKKFSNYTILFDIAKTVKDRRKHPKEGSYTNYLFDKGVDKICKKVGEEASEVIIAAKNSSKDELKNEVADLIYHVIVLLENSNIELDEIFATLSEREGIPAHPKYKNKENNK